MSGIKKIDQGGFSEQIKFRVSPYQLEKLKEVAQVRGSFISDVARAAIDKYLSTLYNGVD